jgi:hypothetical protein
MRAACIMDPIPTHPGAGPRAGTWKPQARETRPCRRTYHGPGPVLSLALPALQRAMEGSLAGCSEIRELLKRRAGTAEGKQRASRGQERPSRSKCGSGGGGLCGASLARHGRVDPPFPLPSAPKIDLPRPLAPISGGITLQIDADQQFFKLPLK